MLTKPAKEVLKMLNSLTDRTEKRITYVINKPQFCLYGDNSAICDYSPYENEIDGIVEMLETDGEIVAIGQHIFRLTQKGLHYRELRSLTRRERWLERLYGFLSGVAITVIGGLIVKYIAG